MSPEVTFMGELGVSKLLLVIRLVICLIGIGFAVYGKREENIVYSGSGIVMILYPFFMSDLIWIGIVFACLAAIPFCINPEPDQD